MNLIGLREFQFKLSVNSHGGTHHDEFQLVPVNDNNGFCCHQAQRRDFQSFSAAALDALAGIHLAGAYCAFHWQYLGACFVSVSRPIASHMAVPYAPLER